VTLSVIIPVRNERDTILEVVERVRAVDVGHPKELIVVDGASTDGTRELLELVRDIVLIREPQARGKGAAVRAGIERATGEVLVIQDADLELDPGVFPAMLKLIESGRSDVVYGVRFARGRGETPWLSYLGNRGFSLLAGALFLHPLNDILTAYKMMRTDIARSLPLTCRGFDLDAEITCRLLKAGHRIAQVPVSYRPRSREQGKKLGFSAGWGVLKAILRVRFERRVPVVAGEPSAEAVSAATVRREQ
jgi:glycosyltransferase involved in cell wall biosynthesis